METRKLKKGEKLFDEKDNLDKVYLIKTGRLTLYVERNGKRIELGVATTGHVLGEKSLFGTAKAGISCMANLETTILETPAAALKPHLDGGQPVLKTLLKGVSDRANDMVKTVSSIKMEGDVLPCSERQVPRVFGVIGLYASQAGVKDEKGGFVTVSWPALKLNATRMYLESPIRLQQAVEILTKLKYTEMVYKHDEIEDEDVLSDIKFFNVPFIIEFADFYQYNYYKGGAGETLKVDEQVMKIVKAVNEVCKDIEADRKGVVDTPYDKVAADLKAKFRLELKPMHFDMLEKKGLFLNRKPREQGMFVQFDKKEFDRIYKFWQLVVEIDKLNEKGVVIMKEEEEKTVPADLTNCPECQLEIQPNFKFCAGCGYKLAA